MLLIYKETHSGDFSRIEYNSNSGAKGLKGFLNQLIFTIYHVLKSWKLMDNRKMRFLIKSVEKFGWWKMFRISD